MNVKQRTLTLFSVLAISFTLAALYLYSSYKNTVIPDNTAVVMPLPKNYEVVPNTVALGFRHTSMKTSRERFQEAVNSGKKIYLNYALRHSNNQGKRSGIFYYWWHEDNHWSESFTEPFVCPIIGSTWYFWKIMNTTKSKTSLTVYYTFKTSMGTEIARGPLAFITSCVLAIICIFLCILLVIPKKSSPPKKPSSPKIAQC
jgi:hypothetical protein